MDATSKAKIFPLNFPQKKVIAKEVPDGFSIFRNNLVGTETASTFDTYDSPLCSYYAGYSIPFSHRQGVSQNNNTNSFISCDQSVSQQQNSPKNQLNSVEIKQQVQQQPQQLKSQKQKIEKELLQKLKGRQNFSEYMLKLIQNVKNKQVKQTLPSRNNYNNCNAQKYIEENEADTEGEEYSIWDNSKAEQLGFDCNQFLNCHHNPLTFYQLYRMRSELYQKEPAERKVLIEEVHTISKHYKKEIDYENLNWQDEYIQLNNFDQINILPLPASKIKNEMLYAPTLRQPCSLIQSNKNFLIESQNCQSLRSFQDTPQKQLIHSFEQIKEAIKLQILNKKKSKHSFNEIKSSFHKVKNTSTSPSHTTNNEMLSFHKIKNTSNSPQQKTNKEIINKKIEKNPFFEKLQQFKFLKLKQQSIIPQIIAEQKKQNLSSENQASFNLDFNKKKINPSDKTSAKQQQSQDGGEGKQAIQKEKHHKISKSDKQAINKSDHKISEQKNKQIITRSSLTSDKLILNSFQNFTPFEKQNNNQNNSQSLTRILQTCPDQPKNSSKTLSYLTSFTQRQDERSHSNDFLEMFTKFQKQPINSANTLQSHNCHSRIKVATTNSQIKEDTLKSPLISKSNSKIPFTTLPQKCKDLKLNSFITNSSTTTQKIADYPINVLQTTQSINKRYPQFFQSPKHKGSEHSSSQQFPKPLSCQGISSYSCHSHYNTEINMCLQDQQGNSYQYGTLNE